MNFDEDSSHGSSNFNPLKREYEDDEGATQAPFKIAKTEFVQQNFESYSNNNTSKTSKKKRKNKKRNKKTKGGVHPMANFEFGNFREYYGFRYPGQDEDTRVTTMNGSWFVGKDVLDIGCNVGEITMEIAKKHNPKRIVGIDIDKELVAGANRTLSERIKNSPELKNVHFITCNYVPDSDDSLVNVAQEFDIILALSLTKWIHLNFGDDGLKRFFKKMFLNLRPGGLLILEPQEWTSYHKKRQITKKHYEMYLTLELLPRDFEAYLLSNKIGFSECQALGTSDNRVKGFQRPMYVFKKE